MKNSGARKYIRMIKNTLPLMYKGRSQIINDIKMDLSDYMDKNRGCSYEDLVNEFGSPEDVVSEYVAETINVEEICKVRRYYFTVSFVVVAIVVCVCSVTLFCKGKSDKSYDDGCTKEMIKEDGFRTEIYMINGNTHYEVETEK